MRGQSLGLCTPGAAPTRPRVLRAPVLFPYPRPRLPAPTPPGALASKSTHSASLPLLAATEGTVATAMDLAHTLLESAVSMRKARFVRNSATYLQTCLVPARDLFVASKETVASMVVVPLVRAGLGAAWRGAHACMEACTCCMEGSMCLWPSQCPRPHFAAVCMRTPSTPAPGPHA